MKRIVSGLLAVFLVDWVSFAEARDTEVVLYPTIGPASVPSFGIVSPSFAGFAANTLFGLQNGRRDVGGRILFTPTAFNTIGGPISNRSGKVKVSVYDTWATKGNSWRGLTPSHGPFANERGTQFRAAVAIKSRTAFSLADVVLSVTYADLPPGTVISLPLGGLPGQGLFQSFESNRLRGIDWGPDGRPGGGDDKFMTATTLGSLAIRNARRKSTKSCLSAKANWASRTPRILQAMSSSLPHTSTISRPTRPIRSPILSPCAACRARSSLPWI
jgi:hypothetical protein